ncbi:MAG: phenylalanine--tRNA ligase subunit alpha [Treponema sp.]|jgi:phenylalanyl-tRNA synthetase alpha chain|nr:phenylalanine--tRNA ligase subunit alpha [Treponema sp.]
MDSQTQTLVKNLHPLEVKVLLAYGPDDELRVQGVEEALSLKAGNGNQALSWLVGKGLAREKRREQAVYYELGAAGRAWQKDGTPEERLLAAARAHDGLSLPEAAAAAGIENKDAGSAYGSLARAGLLSMDGGKRLQAAPPSPGGDGGRLVLVRGLLDRAAAAPGGILAEAGLSPAERDALAGGLARKRGGQDAAFRQVDRETPVYTLTAQALEAAAALREAGISGNEAGALTPEMLENGAWKTLTFRSYNVRTPPTRLIPGRTNPYAQFLEDVKDTLTSLGFEEFDGPLVETEFWNSDALFMPQFHSARDIHDVYRIAEPDHAQAIDEPWLSNVAAAHENGGGTGSRGWRYHFDRDFTRRLILRSQGTVMSAKTLPRAKIPGKYFGILRCFRYDKVDATHNADFYQTEGIVLGENVNLRTLLGMLELFAVEIAGAKEVKYVPGYFPFTEPSVEVHVRHPALGWFELGGSGIFRPEVTASLGVNVPVAAWGIGIDRMALMALGINDLRDLFTSSLESVRLRRVH